MLSSEQVIPDISLPLVVPLPHPIFLSFSRPRASEQQQRGTLSPPAGSNTTPRTAQRQTNGCRTDCFLFRASVPRPLFPRVAAPRGNDKQMSAVVYNGCHPSVAMAMRRDDRRF